LVANRQRAPNEPPVDQLEGSQEKIGSRSKSSANGKVKPDAQKNLEEVAAEQVSKSEDKERDGGRDQLMAISKPGSLVSQIGPSSFYSLRLEATFEEHHAWDGFSTSLGYSKPHA
jgi:hypothetical protein